jgi:hypothetical protein
MSVSLLERIKRIERDLDRFGAELWDADGPDGTLDEIHRQLTSLKVQVGIQKSLQATVNLLRRQPVNQALPNQRANRVKHLIRFVFEQKSGGGERQKQLRAWDCDALKFLGLSYSVKEIVKLDDAEFEILQTRGLEFFRRRVPSHLLYRLDVDKAVDVELRDPDDTYDKFIRGNSARQFTTGHS